MSISKRMEKHQEKLYTVEEWVSEYNVEDQPGRLAVEQVLSGIRQLQPEMQNHFPLE